MRCAAIRAIDNDEEPVETMRDSRRQVLNVGQIESFIDIERNTPKTVALGGKYSRFKLLLDWIGQLIPGMIDHFNTVVTIWIVRGRDHHTGGKRPILREN